MAISQEYLAELSRRTDITELIRGYVQLRRSGRMEKGVCPFHNEKTPSFYVYPDTSSFYCFGCGAGGDAITFMKRISNLDYVEAVKELAARVGMPLPDEDDSAAKLRSRLLAANRQAARFYVECLNAEEGKAARAYLRHRKLTDKTIRSFGLGYAPDSFDGMRNHLKKLGFTEDELLAAGLCKRGQKGGVYDAFRDRVIFPIITLRGEVVAFGGRMMADGRGPKYLNSSDTPVFKKSRHLFALNIAKKSASKRMILAEGYMDAISLHQAGFDTAVATLGTAIGEEQAKLLSDYAEKVVICYDGDEAGQRATARAIGILEKTDLKVQVLSLSDVMGPNAEKAKDPDEFIQMHGADKFDQLLNESANTIEYALGKAKDSHDIATEDGRAAYIKQALEVLVDMALPAEQDIYAGRVAEDTGVAKNAVISQLEIVKKQRQKQFNRRRDKRLAQESIAAGIDVPYGVGGGEVLGVVFAEQQLIAALLKHPNDYMPIVSEKITSENFLASEMRQTYDLLLQKWQSRDYIDLAALSLELDERTMSLLGKILALNHENGFGRKDVHRFLDEILHKQLKKSSSEEMSEDELRSFVEVRKKKLSEE